MATRREIPGKIRDGKTESDISIFWENFQSN